MPDWYEDHKFMILDSLTFRRGADPLEQSREAREAAPGRDSREINDLGQMGAAGELEMAAASPALVPTEAPRRPSARRWTALAMAFGVAAAPLGEAFAQQRVAVVRDAEIEALVRDYAKPIWQAAGLSKS